jgi:hypothetical protein
LIPPKKLNVYRGFINGGTPKIIHFDSMFRYKPSSYGGTPILGNLHVLRE